MPEINVAELKPVGEFGSKAWCEACAHYGVMLLEDGDLPDDLEWGIFRDLHASTSSIAAR